MHSSSCLGHLSGINRLFPPHYNSIFNLGCDFSLLCLRWDGLFVAWKMTLWFCLFSLYDSSFRSGLFMWCYWACAVSPLAPLVQSFCIWWCIERSARLYGLILLCLVGGHCIAYLARLFAFFIIRDSWETWYLLWPTLYILCTVCLQVSLQILPHLANWAPSCRWLLGLTGNLWS